MRFRRHRYPTEYPVTVHLAGGEHRAFVIDVTEAGARLRGLPGATRGDAVTLVTAAGTATGTVRWAAGDRCGIAFRPQISLRMVDSLRFAKVPMTGGRYSSVGLREL